MADVLRAVAKTFRPRAWNSRARLLPMPPGLVPVIRIVFCDIVLCCWSEIDREDESLVIDLGNLKCAEKQIVDKLLHGLEAVSYTHLTLPTKRIV